MSGIKNTYLDLTGLKRYDELIKGFIANGHTELAEAITALNDRLGSLEFEGSDDKNLTGIVESIYTSIADIVEKQIALEEKDAAFEAKDIELAAQIKVIADNLEWAMGGNSENEATIGEINNRLDELKGSVDKIAVDVETAIADAAAANEAIAILKGEGEGSVKKAAADAQDAAEKTAAADATSKADAAEAAAKEYADTLVKDADGNAKFDAAGTAAGLNAAMAARMTDVEGDVAKLKEIDHDKLVADAIAAVVAGADSEFDTLKEVAEWIAADTTGSAELQVTVSGHTDSINTINGEIDTLEAKVDKDIKDLEDHMSAADIALAEVDGRLDKLEAFEETHSSIDLNDIDGLFSDNTGSEPEE